MKTSLPKIPRNPFFRYYPSEMAAHFVARGQTQSGIHWEVGDEVNRFWKIAQDNDVPLTKRHILYGFGELVGKSWQTIKAWAEVAAFYPSDVRRRYRILWFSHFRYAMGHRFIWEEILETDLRLCHLNHGRPVGLNVLDHLFSDRIQAEYERELMETRTDDQIEMVVEEGELVVEATKQTEAAVLEEEPGELAVEGVGERGAEILRRRVIDAIRFLLRALPKLGINDVNYDLENDVLADLLKTLEGLTTDVEMI